MVFPVTTAAIEINLKKTQAGGKISGLAHTGWLPEELMFAAECTIQVTIWPCFPPHFANRCPLSCRRTAFEPENTQIRGGEWGGKKPNKDVYSYEEKEANTQHQAQYFSFFFPDTFKITMNQPFEQYDDRTPSAWPQHCNLRTPVFIGGHRLTPICPLCSLTKWNHNEQLVANVTRCWL